MREYTVEQSSLTFKWTFKRMLPRLPGPGSDEFPDLCKGLHPFGLTPSKVMVEASSPSRMSDISIGIGLLNNRLGIRITPESIEFVLNELLVDDEEKLIPIADLVFAAVRAVDEDAIYGTANFKTSSHFKLPPGENAELMREHQGFEESGLDLDAVVYKVDLGNDSPVREFRMAVAKSLAYEDAVFVDTSVTYEGPATPTELATYINTDAERALELIGLREKAEPAEAGGGGE